MIQKPFLTLFLMVSFFAKSQIVINEIASKNKSHFADHNGNYWDWIELYNSGVKTVNLENYCLSKPERSQNNWFFPSVKIKPEQFLVVHASGESTASDHSLYSSFKIKSGGDTVYLANSKAEIIDSVICIPLSKNTSYARIVDGTGYFMWTDQPSPNYSNSTINTISFSSPTGFYTASFKLKLKTKRGFKIHYTLDGSQPSIHSYQYKKPILITDQSSTEKDIGHISASKTKNRVKKPYQKATVIRAAVFEGNQQVSATQQRTYFVLDSDKNRFQGISVVSLVIDSVDLFDEKRGIYANGSNYVRDKETGNYTMRGKDWERKAVMTYFDQKGHLSFSQPVGIRIHGGKGRRFPQKSFRLYARKKYKAPFFNYPFFEGRSSQFYKRIVLRNSYNAWGRSMIKDDFISKLLENLNFYVLKTKPTIVFINGNYWGIYSIREYFDEYFLAANEGNKPSDYSIVTHGFGTKTHKLKGLIKGNADDLIHLYAFLETHSLKTYDNFLEVDSVLNIKSIIDYYCAEIFLNNRDWPENNNKLWRASNGKWTQFLYDMDATCSTLNTNTIADLKNTKTNKNPKPYVTLLFRKLIESEYFVIEFSKRMSDLLKHTFHIDTVSPMLKNIVEQYVKYVPEHLSRWNVTSSVTQWQANLERIRTFFIKRPSIVRDMFRSEFSIDLSKI